MINLWDFFLKTQLNLTQTLKVLIWASSVYFNHLSASFVPPAIYYVSYIKLISGLHSLLPGEPEEQFEVQLSQEVSARMADEILCWNQARTAGLVRSADSLRWIVPLSSGPLDPIRGIYVKLAREG